jgi:hypothetical protein
MDPDDAASSVAAEAACAVGTAAALPSTLAAATFPARIPLALQPPKVNAAPLLPSSLSLPPPSLLSLLLLPLRRPSAKLRRSLRRHGGRLT